MNDPNTARRHGIPVMYGGLEGAEEYMRVALEFVAGGDIRTAKGCVRAARQLRATYPWQFPHTLVRATAPWISSR